MTTASARGGLRLWTFVSNERTQRFYLRRGFREVERTDGSRSEEGSPDIQYAWDSQEAFSDAPAGVLTAG